MSVKFFICSLCIADGQLPCKLMADTEDSVPPVNCPFNENTIPEWKESSP